jgi:hypothetical protein
MDLVRKLVWRHLAGRNFAPVELLQEFGPGQLGELRCLALGDDSLGVPLDRCGDAHLASELAGRQPKGAESRGVELEADRSLWS